MPVAANGVVYFVDEEARDIARLTGLPWCWRRVHQRGVLHPYLEVTDLAWWDRWRVAWACIGAHYWSTQ